MGICTHGCCWPSSQCCWQSPPSWTFQMMTVSRGFSEIQRHCHSLPLSLIILRTWRKDHLTISEWEKELPMGLVWAKEPRITLVWASESSGRRAGENGCHTTLVSADKSC